MTNRDAFLMKKDVSIPKMSDDIFEVVGIRLYEITRLDIPLFMTLITNNHSF